MHELGLALRIVDLVTRRARNAQAIRRVTVEVGPWAAVLPDALRASFELASQGTPAAGATLEIIEEPARGHCRRCGEEQALESLEARCVCGGTEIDWVSGNQLLVRSMEIV